MLRDQNIFKYRLALEETDILEGTGDAQSRDFVRRGRQHLVSRVHHRIFSPVKLFHLALGMVLDNLTSFIVDRSVGGSVYAGNHVEGCGLAGAVRSDERDDLSLIHLQVQVVHSDDAAKLHGYIFDF